MRGEGGSRRGIDFEVGSAAKEGEEKGGEKGVEFVRVRERERVAD